MAEAAPLNRAHDHARKAATELEHAHFAEAAQEHHLASADFSRAARGTSDVEALRVLKLLEEQHRKLANIIKLQDAPHLEVPTAVTKATGSGLGDSDASSTSPPPSQAAATKAKALPTALASARVGSQVRESSPSLARDIASRRGIPQPGKAQPSPAAQARARQLSPNSQRRLPPQGVPKVPPSIVDSQTNLQQASKSKKAEDDEGFARFYSSMTSGTMSKLSSVLAYAGLPLTTEEAQPDHSARQKQERRTVSASNDPDVKKIFSKAALDAIEEEHRQRGTLGHGFGPAESFYVVQTGGGTFSYADIAKAQQNQLRGIAEEDDAEFVDAKEVPGPPSPKYSRSSHQKRGSFGSPATQEELELENATLKHTLEQLAGRLAAFEAHAQDASMAQLTQSVANLRPGPSGLSSDAAVQERMRLLERQVEQQAEEKHNLEMHAAKLDKVNKKWKAKFDELAKGARAKREKGEKAVVDEPVGEGVAKE